MTSPRNVLQNGPRSQMQSPPADYNNRGRGARSGDAYLLSKVIADERPDIYIRVLRFA
jgi:hypothetical protein